ncbi:uncharacterized protein MYCFIDRAFT_169514 [Pseudocercospora fijiensis CIRAD86]|uniref:Uncharacterized protein n=1 Tax=Pseudocercospora fijiensis (strain CIRAD86) TaxID=383855 RepID=N1QA33_PSEFD|nr:uncharacterized protein MYCFIDRAFT_169514 [Pseudocercospora fijiensis CIRAD86]EME87752.1 hypothetical protein MYCFIDRAFT_169514 [Pseudocercospora fijiensis CIRAD86]
MTHRIDPARLWKAHLELQIASSKLPKMHAGQAIDPSESRIITIHPQRPSTPPIPIVVAHIEAIPLIGIVDPYRPHQAIRRAPATVVEVQPAVSVKRIAVEESLEGGAEDFVVYVNARASSVGVVRPIAVSVVASEEGVYEDPFIVVHAAAIIAPADCEDACRVVLWVGGGLGGVVVLESGGLGLFLFPWYFWRTAESLAPVSWLLKLLAFPLSLVCRPLSLATSKASMDCFGQPNPRFWELTLYFEHIDCDSETKHRLLVCFNDSCLPMRHYLATPVHYRPRNQEMSRGRNVFARLQYSLVHSSQACSSRKTRLPVPVKRERSLNWRGGCHRRLRYVQHHRGRTTVAAPGTQLFLGILWFKRPHAFGGLVILCPKVAGENDKPGLKLKCANYEAAARGHPGTPGVPRGRPLRVQQIGPRSITHERAPLGHLTFATLWEVPEVARFVNDRRKSVSREYWCQSCISAQEKMVHALKDSTQDDVESRGPSQDPWKLADRTSGMITGTCFRRTHDDRCIELRSVDQHMLPHTTTGKVAFRYGPTREELLETISAMQKMSQLQETAQRLKDKAAAVSNPNERERLLKEAYEKEVEANGHSRMARRMQSGTWQGLFGGGGIGAGVGMGLGAVLGTLVGGVASVATVPLGALTGAGVGAWHGPWIKVGNIQKRFEDASPEEVVSALEQEKKQQAPGSSAQHDDGQAGPTNGVPAQKKKPRKLELRSQKTSESEIKHSEAT